MPDTLDKRENHNVIKCNSIVPCETLGMKAGWMNVGKCLISTAILNLCLTTFPSSLAQMLMVFRGIIGLFLSKYWDELSTLGEFFAPWQQINLNTINLA